MYHLIYIYRLCYSCECAVRLEDYELFDALITTIGRYVTKDDEYLKNFVELGGFEILCSFIDV